MPVPAASARGYRCLKSIYDFTTTVILTFHVFLQNQFYAYMYEYIQLLRLLLGA